MEIDLTLYLYTIPISPVNTSIHSQRPSHSLLARGGDVGRPALYIYTSNDLHPYLGDVQMLCRFSTSPPYPDDLIVLLVEYMRDDNSSLATGTLGSSHIM